MYVSVPNTKWYTTQSYGVITTWEAEFSKWVALWDNSKLWNYFILQRYDNLFERNAKNGSFYLQSKVHRAKECLEEIYKKNEQAPSWNCISLLLVSCFSFFPFSFFIVNPWVGHVDMTYVCPPCWKNKKEGNWLLTWRLVMNEPSLTGSFFLCCLVFNVVPTSFLRCKQWEFILVRVLCRACGGSGRVGFWFGKERMKLMHSQSNPPVPHTPYAC